MQIVNIEFNWAQANFPASLLPASWHNSRQRDFLANSPTRLQHFNNPTLQHSSNSTGTGMVIFAPALGAY
jgi:hypothetical protein